MHRSWLFVALASLGALAVAQRGEACSCERYPSVSSPSPGAAKVPTNVRIAAALPYEWPTPHVDASDDASPRAKYHVELRTPATSTKPAKTLAAKVETIASDYEGTVLLAPEAPLVPGTLYEVWAVDESDAHASRLLRVVRADSFEDHDAPAWKAAPTVEYLGPIPPGSFAMCGSGPDLSFDRIAATDLGPVVSYEVWLSPGAAVDVTKAPTLVATAITDSTSTSFSIGKSNCSWPATIPSDPALHVGVRAIDWAGNRSSLIEKVLDTTPTKKP